MKFYLVTANCGNVKDCLENVYTVVTHKKDAYYWIYKFIIFVVVEQKAVYIYYLSFLYSSKNFFYSIINQYFSF